MYSLEEIKEAGLHDFQVFLRQIWDVLELPEPTPVQNDMARHLQHGPRRMIVEAFRGVGKSWITVAFVLWLLFLDPQVKVLVVSANQERADAFSIFCKQLIYEAPLLAHLRFRQGQERTSNVAFDVGPATPDQSPSVKSVGITGQLTGSRANYIIADDIEVTKNSFTHLLRERIAELVKEFDAVLKPGGRVIYLGTPQTEQSLYNRLPSRGYDIRIWPAEVPKGINQYGGKLAPYVVDKVLAGVPAGTPIDPLRFHEADLAERHASYGNSGYALQFMLDTNPSDLDKHPLKLADLIIHNVDPEVAPVKIVWGKDKDLRIDDLAPGGFDGDYYHRPVWKSDEYADFGSLEPGQQFSSIDTKKFGGTIMFIDPSGMGRDETAYAIVRYHHSMLYLVDVGGFTSGFSEATLHALALAAKTHKVNWVTMERNYGGGMFGSLLRPVMAEYCKSRVLDVDEMTWSTGLKERRILDSLEPVVQNHRLVVDRRVIERDLVLQQDSKTQKYSFIQQFTRLTRDKGSLAHDDRVEAVAEACKFWTDRMSMSKEKALQRVHTNRRRETLATFLRTAKRIHNFGKRTSTLWAGRQ